MQKTLIELHEGKIAAEGTPAELKKLLPSGMIKLAFSDARTMKTAETVLDMYRIAKSSDDNLSISVLTDGTVDALTDILTKLKQANTPALKLEQETPTLEDAFFAIIGYDKNGGNQ